MTNRERGVILDDYESTHTVHFQYTNDFNRLMQLIIFFKPTMNRLRPLMTRIGRTSATASYGYALEKECVCTNNLMRVSSYLVIIKHSELFYGFNFIIWGAFVMPPLTVTHTLGLLISPHTRPIRYPGTLYTKASRHVHLYVPSVFPLFVESHLVICADNGACDSDVDDDESSNTGPSSGKLISPSAMVMLVQCLALQVPPAFIFQVK